MDVSNIIDHFLDWYEIYYKLRLDLEGYIVEGAMHVTFAKKQ